MYDAAWAIGLAGRVYGFLLAGVEGVGGFWGWSAAGAEDGGVGWAAGGRRCDDVVAVEVVGGVLFAHG